MPSSTGDGEGEGKVGRGLGKEKGGGCGSRGLEVFAGRYHDDVFFSLV